MGQDYENNLCFQPAIDTRGGILLGAKKSMFALHFIQSSENFITATVKEQKRNISWIVTRVYGPQGDLEKCMFLREIKRVKGLALPQWLVLGDFNFIYKDHDKSNGRLNRRLMTRFRRALNFIEVKEIELIGRSFTWSNNKSNPTLARIERMFCTPAWEELFLNYVLQPLSPSTSDHCPLMLLPQNP
jgi:hypothetical protein